MGLPSRRQTAQRRHGEARFATNKERAELMFPKRLHRLVANGERLRGELNAIFPRQANVQFQVNTEISSSSRRIMTFRRRQMGIWRSRPASLLERKRRRSDQILPKRDTQQPTVTGMSSTCMKSTTQVTMRDPGHRRVPWPYPADSGGWNLCRDRLAARRQSRFHRLYDGTRTGSRPRSWWLIPLSGASTHTRILRASRSG